MTANIRERSRTGTAEDTTMYMATMAMPAPKPSTPRPTTTAMATGDHAVTAVPRVIAVTAMACTQASGSLVPSTAALCMPAMHVTAYAESTAPDRVMAPKSVIASGSETATAAVSKPMIAKVPAIASVMARCSRRRPVSGPAVTPSR